MAAKFSTATTIGLHYAHCAVGSFYCRTLWCGIRTLRSYCRGHSRPIFC